MRRRLPQVLVAVLALAATVALVRLLVLLDDQGYERAETDEVAYSVEDALAVAADRPIPVRGWVYDDGSFLQLCNGLVDGDPPRCQGPSLLLDGIDRARLDLETAEDGAGTTVSYTDGPVILAGVVSGTRMSVTELLADPGS